jgi:hypothetical protein
MHTSKICGAALLALALLAVSASAWSHGGWRHGHRHSGVSLGFVFGAPLWYPPLYAYPPAAPAVVVPPAPRVYIEREPAVVLRESNPGYWYYCRESNTYYPYVKECAGPWERVPARPQ